jgi:NADP-dependent 3-hydroxy acid dehydrogenase YdfG
VVEDIYDRIWELSPDHKIIEARQELLQLTDDLIEIYDEQDRLNADPFEPTRKREISLPYARINNELKDTTCFVTGGSGCVGSKLVEELLKFDVKLVVILDISMGANLYSSNRIINVECDIRDISMLHECFEYFQPDLVFHTAALRDPGYAERHLEDAVDTNVIGTFNVAHECETSGTVKQMVYCSTGKASRYFTEEIYAATKKMSEFIVDGFAKGSDVKYSMVRFTHILDNSLMNIELSKKCQSDDCLAIHSPGKYVTAQNALEAAHLMLNALIFSERGNCNFLLVKHLEWPVESLQMALYYIKNSGRSIPVIFTGNPAGYSEKLFRGQFDWSKPKELNLLINVYEQKSQKLNSLDDIIISRICSTDAEMVSAILNELRTAEGDEAKRIILLEGLRKLVSASLVKVDKADTVKILRWGLDARYVDRKNEGFQNCIPITSLLVGSLIGSEYDMESDELTSLNAVLA